MDEDVIQAKKLKCENLCKFYDYFYLRDVGQKLRRANLRIKLDNEFSVSTWISKYRDVFIKILKIIVIVQEFWHGTTCLFCDENIRVQ